MRAGEMSYHTHLVEISLDDRALDHLKSELLFGHVLARRAAQELSLERGLITVIVPSTFGGDLYDFQTGGKFREDRSRAVPIEGGQAVPLPNADEHVARTLLEESKTVVFENYNARRSDPWISKADLRVAFYGTDVYHVSFKHEGIISVMRTIAAAKSTPFAFGVGSSVCNSKWLASRLEWSDDDLSAILAEVRVLVLGVYDGESFLVWRRG